MKSLIIILAMLLSLNVNIYAENPYKQFGCEGRELLTDQEKSGVYIFELKSKDEKSGVLLFNIKENNAVLLSVTNDTLNVYKIDPKIPNRWLSIDPLSSNHPGESPYSSFGNKPISNIDPDGRDYYKSTDGKFRWFPKEDDTFTENENEWHNIGVNYACIRNGTAEYWGQWKDDKGDLHQKLIMTTKNLPKNFNGWEDYNKWDAYIACFAAMHPRYEQNDPDFIKSILIQESAGEYGIKTGGFNNDPMTMFNDFDINKGLGNEQEVLSMRNEKEPYKQYKNAILSIKSGVNWLFNRKFDKATDPTTNLSAKDFDTKGKPYYWWIAYFYNASTLLQTTTNGKLQQKIIYAERVLFRMNNPSTFVPNEYGQTNKKYRYNINLGY